MVNAQAHPLFGYKIVAQYKNEHKNKTYGTFYLKAYPQH